VTELPAIDLENWRELPPEDRQDWLNQLWLDTIALADRYRLALRSGWWEDSIQVEALQAFAAWVRLYDAGAYTDPPGKLQLLFEIERLRGVLRGGEQAFDALRDRPQFERHLQRLTSTHDDQHDQADAPPMPAARYRQLAHALASVTERLAELRERERTLDADLTRGRTSRMNDVLDDTRAEHDRLKQTIEQLERRERELQSQLNDSASD
jgi:hypothetical protein